jgi:hypothetical protein
MEGLGKGKDCAKSIQFPARLVLEPGITLSATSCITLLDKSIKDSGLSRFCL